MSRLIGTHPWNGPRSVPASYLFQQAVKGMAVGNRGSSVANLPINVRNLLFDRAAFTNRLEVEKQQVKSQLENVKTEDARVQMRDTKRFVLANLRNVRELLNGEARTVRAELAKNVQKIILTPQGRTYTAAGTWSFLGLGCYDGAGGPACTTRRIEFQVSLAA
jgi:hypothetical protein